MAHPDALRGPRCSQNRAECAYDGGDCCECTCDDSDGNCSRYSNFACIDPEAPCVDDDSFTADMIENCGSPSNFGDGWCHEENNTEECGYDGGDVRGAWNLSCFGARVRTTRVVYSSFFDRTLCPASRLGCPCRALAKDFSSFRAVCSCGRCRNARTRYHCCSSRSDPQVIHDADR